jgi:hypothetical protein
MKNGFAFAILGIAMTMVLVISGAFAGDEEIWGTYRLVTATNKYLDTGDVVSAFGEHAAIELSTTLTYRGMKLGAAPPSFVTLLEMATV